MSRYDPKDGDVSYLLEMLAHPANIVTASVAGLAGAALLVTAGPLAAALPFVALVGGEGIAALFVPSSVVFKEFVNRGKRSDARDKERERLLEELNSRVQVYRHPTDEWGQRREDRRPSSGHLDRYNRIRERVERFYELSAEGGSALTYTDAERLDDLSVDFLRLWLVTYTLHERGQSIDVGDLTKRVRSLNEQIKDANVLEQRKLASARDGLQKVLDRRSSFSSQRDSAEARMLTMADGIEEMYSRTLASPGEASSFLDDQLGRLEVEERLGAELDIELAEMGLGKTLHRDPRMDLLMDGNS